MIPGGTRRRHGKRQGLSGLGECVDCQEPIRFVTMAQTGRAMPVNPKPHDADTHGTVAARLRGPILVGYVITLDHPGTLTHPYRFTPHYATCTARKATTNPAPAEDPALF